MRNELFDNILNIPRKLTEAENYLDTLYHLDEMGNLHKLDTNLPMNIWVDEKGSNRNVEHNFPRLKFQGDSSNRLDDTNLIPISISKNPEILLENPPKLPSRFISLIKKFIIHNRDILEDHFNQKIRTQEMYQKIRVWGFYSFDNILEMIPPKIKELFSNEEIEQEFYRTIYHTSRERNGLLKNRLNKTEVLSFLSLFFDNDTDCMTAIISYDNKAF
jgi:hypothetical protein